ncbi:MAG: hypothetical protein IJO21_02510 [Oscillospiraceae bacterium]|nr:hypothetical protein [Oscillospiraceae bacterium]
MGYTSACKAPVPEKIQERKAETIGKTNHPANQPAAIPTESAEAEMNKAEKKRSAEADRKQKKRIQNPAGIRDQKGQHQRKDQTNDRHSVPGTAAHQRRIFRSASKAGNDAAQKATQKEKRKKPSTSPAGKSRELMLRNTGHALKSLLKKILQKRFA